MKKSERPSADHCGSMFFAGSKPPSARTLPLATSSSAMRGLPASRLPRFVLKRSVAKAIERPSGDHDGVSSEYASLVNRRS